MEFTVFLSLKHSDDEIICDGLMDAKPGCTLVAFLRGFCFPLGYPMALLCTHFSHASPMLILHPCLSQRDTVLLLGYRIASNAPSLCCQQIVGAYILRWMSCTCSPIVPVLSSSYKVCVCSYEVFQQELAVTNVKIFQVLSIWFIYSHFNIFQICCI